MSTPPNGLDIATQDERTRAARDRQRVYREQLQVVSQISFVTSQSTHSCKLTRYEQVRPAIMASILYLAATTRHPCGAFYQCPHSCLHSLCFHKSKYCKFWKHTLLSELFICIFWLIFMYLYINNVSFCWIMIQCVKERIICVSLVNTRKVLPVYRA